MARIKGWPAKYKGLRRYPGRGKNRRAKCKACQRWCVAMGTMRTHLVMLYADLTTLCVECGEKADSKKRKGKS